jgi:predicted transglutaminase-like cysteine proteinase
MSLASSIRRMAVVALGAVTLVDCLTFVGGEARAAKVKASKGPRLFGTMEFKGKIKKLPKWSGVLTKMKAWKGYFKDPDLAKLPSKAGWNKLKGDAKGMAPLDKVKAVNKFFNQWPYRLDAGNYGKSDYWATPKEFLQKSGDCEDYSIAKFYALQELGFSGDTMRVVALKDRIRNIGHAVLAVYLDGTVYILDNQTAMVMPHTKYKHYLPQYSVNEKYRWMHVPPGKKTTYKRKKKKKKKKKK